MASDGFATLTSSMLVRARPGETPRGVTEENAVVRQAPALKPVPAAPAPAPVQPKPAAGKGRANGANGSAEETRSLPAERRGPKKLFFGTGRPAAGAKHAVPEIDKPHYRGPERRMRDVSPDIERRRSVKKRVKVTVRLEQDRYFRLRLASTQLGRTHQDLLTAALDTYLDLMGADRFGGNRNEQ